METTKIGGGIFSGISNFAGNLRKKIAIKLHSQPRVDTAELSSELSKKAQLIAEHLKTVKSQTFQKIGDLYCNYNQSENRLHISQLRLPTNENRSVNMHFNLDTGKYSVWYKRPNENRTAHPFSTKFTEDSETDTSAARIHADSLISAVYKGITEKSAV